MEFVELTLEEFNQFSMSHKETSFTQSYPMARVMMDDMRKVLAYGVKEDGRIIAGGLFILRPVISKFMIAHCNQGPLLDYSQPPLVAFFFKHLKIALKKEQVIYALITPNFSVVSRDENGEFSHQFDHHHYIDHLKSAGLKHLGYDNSLINGVGRWFFVKDFTEIKEDQHLLSSLNQAGRTKINKTRKSDLTIENRTSDLQSFIEIMDHTADRRYFNHRTLDYYQSLIHHFKDDIKVFVASIDFKKQKENYQSELEKIEEDLALNQERLHQNPNSKKQNNVKKELTNQKQALLKRIEEASTLPDIKQDIACAMFIYYGNEITYLFSGAYEQYFQFDGPYALQDAAFKWGLEKGITRYNFYGTTGHYSQHEDEGVYLFKRSFGGIVKEQPGNFKLVINPLLNSLYEFSRIFRK